MNNTITDHINIWITAQTQKSMGRNRGIDNIHQHGVKRLRELIIKLALRGMLVSQNNNDEHAKILFERIQKDLCLKQNLKSIGKLKRDKSIIGPEEFQNKIPKNWIWSELNDISIFTNGKAHEQFITEVPNYILINSRFVSSEGEVSKYAEERLTPLFKNDIAIVMSDVPGGKAIAKCFLVEEDEKYTLNQRIGCITTSEYLFVKYLFLALDRNQYYLNYDDGQKQTNLKKIQILSCPIPIPPLAEQHRIVSKVDELMALCDKLEQQQTNSLETHQLLVETLLKTLTDAKDAAELNQAWQQIESNFSLLFTTEESVNLLKQTILQLAVMGKLTQDFRENNPELVSGANSARELLKKIAAEKEKLIAEGKIKKQNPLPEITDDEKPFELPEGWEFVQLTNLCELITKGSSPKWQGVSYTDNQSDVLFVTSENVGSYELLLENRKYVEQKFNEIEPRSILQKGDFLMNIVGASIGRTAIYNIEEVANINQAVCLIRTIPQFLNDTFLLHFFNSDICVSYMFDKQVDNARANLSMGNISKFVIPIPPRTEQHQIVAKVDELFTLCDALKERIDESQEIKIKLADAVVEVAVKNKLAGKVIYPVNEQLSLAAEPE